MRTVDKSKKGDESRVPQYIREAKRMGIKVNPPDIRFSQAQVSVHEGEIYFGFSEVKGVASAGEYLVKMREDGAYPEEIFSSPERLSEAIGAVSEEENEAKRAAKAEGKPYPKEWKSAKQMINDGKINALLEAGAWDCFDERDISMSAKQKGETEYLGVILTDNSEKILAANFDTITEVCDDFSDALIPWAEKEGEFDWTDNDGQEIPPEKRFIDYQLAGTVMNIRPTRVKSNGASMGIVTIEFERHELEFACYSRQWKTHKFLFQPRNVGLFKIRHTAPNAKRNKEGYSLDEGRLLHE